MTRYTQAEYGGVLLARQAEHIRQHPPAPGREWLRPLMEWFIREDDEVEGVTVDVPPAVRAAPRPVRRPVTAPLVRDRLARNREALAAVEARLAALTADSGPRDPAMVNVPLSRRPGRITDAALERWRRLSQREASLRSRILLDEARLRKLESAESRLASR